MLHGNNHCKFRLLMTVIDVAYDRDGLVADAHSLGASEKMFYHDVCYETIYGFGVRQRSVRRAESGEPGVRQASERLDGRRDPQT